MKSSAFDSALSPMRASESGIFSPSRNWTSCYDETNVKPRRSSLRLALIPAINRAVNLQKEALRLLKYRTAQTDLQANHILQESIQTLHQCSEFPHPVLDDMLSSVRDLRKEYQLRDSGRPSLSPPRYGFVPQPGDGFNPTMPYDAEATTTHLDTMASQPPPTAHVVSRPDPPTSSQPTPSQGQYDGPIRGDDEVLIDVDIKRNHGLANSTKWNALVGLDDAKARLREMITLRSRFAHLIKNHKDPPNGALLYGPPGTGKTSLIQAAAEHFGWNAMFVSAGDILSKYCGDSEKKIKQIFRNATELSPCLLFIDEIDSLGQARNQETSALCRRILTELMIHLSRLSEPPPENALDGASQGAQVLFLAATNEPWSLDGALLRRLPYKLYTPYLERHQIVTLISHQLPHVIPNENRPYPPCCLKNKVEIEAVAEELTGYSPSDICSILSDAVKAPLRCAMQVDQKFCVRYRSDPNGQPKLITTPHGPLCESEHPPCTILDGEGLEAIYDPESLTLRDCCLCDLLACKASTVKSLQFPLERYASWALGNKSG